MANTRTPKAKSLAEITEQATPAEVIVSVCVAGKLITEHQRLDRELERLQDNRLRADSPKLSPAAAKPDPEEERLVKRLHTLEEQIQAQTYDFAFRKIDKSNQPEGHPATWADLMDEHGPRRGKERQERWNPTTFPPAAVRASCVSPDGMNDEETFRKFWDTVLNEGQRDDLFNGAQRANEAALSVPFSVSASAHRQSSEQSSTTA